MDKKKEKRAARERCKRVRRRKEGRKDEKKVGGNK